MKGKKRSKNELVNPCNIIRLGTSGWALLWPIQTLPDLLETLDDPSDPTDGQNLSWRNFIVIEKLTKREPPRLPEASWAFRRISGLRASCFVMDQPSPLLPSGIILNQNLMSPRTFVWPSHPSSSQIHLQLHKCNCGVMKERKKKRREKIQRKWKQWYKID